MSDKAAVYLYITRLAVFVERDPRRHRKYVDFYASHDVVYRVAKDTALKGWAQHIERIAICVARDYAESGGSQRDLKLVYDRKARKRKKVSENQMSMFGGGSQ